MRAVNCCMTIGLALLGVVPTCYGGQDLTDVRVLGTATLQGGCYAWDLDEDRILYGSFYDRPEGSTDYSPVLVAADTDEGRELWSVVLPGDTGSRQVVRMRNGPVVVLEEWAWWTGGSGNRFTAFDPQTGAELWQKKMRWSPEHPPFPVKLALSAFGALVLRPGELTLRDPNDWSVQWSLRLPGDGQSVDYPFPVVSDGRVFCIVDYLEPKRRLLVSVEEKTGRKLGQADLGPVGFPNSVEDPVELGECAVASQRIVCLSEPTTLRDIRPRRYPNASLVCFDAATGRRCWRQELPSRALGTYDVNTRQPVACGAYVLMDVEGDDAYGFRRLAYRVDDGCLVGETRVVTRTPEGDRLAERGQMAVFGDTAVCPSAANALAFLAPPSFESVQQVTLPITLTSPLDLNIVSGYVVAVCPWSPPGEEGRRTTVVVLGESDRSTGPVSSGLVAIVEDKDNWDCTDRTHDLFTSPIPGGRSCKTIALSWMN